MADKEKLAIGDPVEVLMIYPAGEEWVPATVSFVDRSQLVAVFSDGERLTLPHHRGRYRAIASQGDEG